MSYDDDREEGKRLNAEEAWENMGGHYHMQHIEYCQSDYHMQHMEYCQPDCNICNCCKCENCGNCEECAEYEWQNTLDDQKREYAASRGI